MDINSDPCLPPLSEPESRKCSADGSCETEGCLYADVRIPVELSANAVIGKIKAECCEKPVICCKENLCCSTCEVIIEQKICIRVPIKYCASASVGCVEMKCCDCDHNK